MEFSAEQIKIMIGCLYNYRASLSRRQHDIIQSYLAGVIDKAGMDYNLVSIDRDKTEIDLILDKIRFYPD